MLPLGTKEKTKQEAVPGEGDGGRGSRETG